MAQAEPWASSFAGQRPGLPPSRLTRQQQGKTQPKIQCVPSENDPQARLGFEVIDGIFFDDCHAASERKLHLVGQFCADQRIEGKKLPPGLTRYRGAVINADIVAWVKGEKKRAWQIDVQGRGNLRFADPSLSWIGGRAQGPAHR